MTRYKNKLALASLLLTVSLLAFPAANATHIEYVYQDASFDGCPTCSIFGTIVVDDSLYGMTSDSTMWDFWAFQWTLNGVDTFIASSALGDTMPGGGFNVLTLSLTGEILGYSLCTGLFSSCDPDIDGFWIFGSADPAEHFALLADDFGTAFQGLSQDNAWTATTLPVSEPTIFLLMSISLLALGASVRVRKRN